MDAAAHLQEGLVPNMVAAGNAAHNHLPRQQHQEQQQQHQQQRRQPAETVASSTSSQTAVRCFNTAPQPQYAAPGCGTALAQELMDASAPANVPQQQQQQQQQEHMGAALPQVVYAAAVAWLPVWAPAAALQPAALEAAAAGGGGGGGVAGADALAAADAAAAAIMNDIAAAEQIDLVGDEAFLGWLGDAWLPEMVAVDALQLHLMAGLQQQQQQQQLLLQQEDPQEPSTPSQMAGLLSRGWTQELKDSLPRSNTVAAGA